MACNASVDPDLLALARRQHGLLTVRQVTDAGHRNLLRARLGSGEWVEEQPRVVRPVLWQPNREARLAAVRLALTPTGVPRGWCFSHTTAAHLQRLKVPEPSEVHVLLPTSRRKLPLRGTVRHFTEKPPRTMRVRSEPKGLLLPTGMLVPTVLQCAAVLLRNDLLALVEDLLREERLNIDVLRDACGRGISGSAALQDALDELDADGADRWVRRLVRLLTAGGLPRPALEVPMYDGARVRAYLDGFYEEAKLAVEVDDWESHGLRDASEHDRQRDRWLYNAYGILTIRLTPREIRDHPEKVVADIVAAYEKRRKTIN